MRPHEKKGRTQIWGHGIGPQWPSIFVMLIQVSCNLMTKMWTFPIMVGFPEVCPSLKVTIHQEVQVIINDLVLFQHECSSHLISNILHPTFVKNWCWSGHQFCHSNRHLFAHLKICIVLQQLEIRPLFY